MEKLVKIIFHFCRIALGLVFIFSGFVKGVDPLGSAYKFNDYFLAAGLPQMDTLSLILSFLLSGAEFLIGIALLTGIFMRLTAWTALFFMAFFTILTLILAIFNPVTDCGCFGDAIKLTNWQTFYKNIIFSILVIIIFIKRNDYELMLKKITSWAIAGVAIIFFFILSLQSYNHLPLLDFMPYKVGSNIPEMMKVPDGAPQDEYETLLLYKNKNTGEIREFTMKNYPWQDTVNWQWSDTKSVLIKKGYTPPIHDFNVASPSGTNITDSILKGDTYTFLFISYNLNKANIKALKLVNKLALFGYATGKFKFYAVTASTNSDIQRVRNENDLVYDFNSADETALKTVIRSNPGLLLLKNGIVIGKWHYNDIKTIDPNVASLLSDEIATINANLDFYKSMTWGLILGFILLLIWAISIYESRKI